MHIVRRALLNLYEGHSKHTRNSSVTKMPVGKNKFLDASQKKNCSL